MHGPQVHRSNFHPSSGLQWDISPSMKPVGCEPIYCMLFLCRQQTMEFELNSVEQNRTKAGKDNQTARRHEKRQRKPHTASGIDAKWTFSVYCRLKSFEQSNRWDCYKPFLLFYKYLKTRDVKLEVKSCRRGWTISTIDVWNLQVWNHALTHFVA